MTARRASPRGLGQSRPIEGALTGSRIPRRAPPPAMPEQGPTPQRAEPVALEDELQIAHEADRLEPPGRSSQASVAEPVLPEAAEHPARRPRAEAVFPSLGRGNALPPERDERVRRHGDMKRARQVGEGVAQGRTKRRRTVRSTSRSQSISTEGSRRITAASAIHRSGGTCSHFTPWAHVWKSWSVASSTATGTPCTVLVAACSQYSSSAPGQQWSGRRCQCRSMRWPRASENSIPWLAATRAGVTGTLGLHPRSTSAVTALCHWPVRTSTSTSSIGRTPWSR